MKKIEVIISPDAADRVIELLEEQSVSGFTLSSILARDSSGTRPRMYRGHSYTAALVSKLKVEAVVPDNRASAIASAIMDAAQGPGCSPDPRAVIIAVTEVLAESTESSPKTPRALKHRRPHPGAQTPGAPADAAPAGPIPAS